MLKNKSALICLSVLLTIAPFVSASDYFTIAALKVHGLKRVSTGAVLNELPFKAGSKISEEDVVEAVKTLYATGFFRKVDIFQDGNDLVVEVEERPTVSTLVIKGVKDKEKTKKNLRDMGLAEGRMFDPNVVTKVQKELEKYYLTKGRYGVRIELRSKEVTPGLMEVTVDIYEGSIAKVKKIQLLGNKAFTDKELLKEFKTASSNWLSWFTSDDHYLKEKLLADLESIKSYYMDRGYFNVQVENPQVTLNEEKKHIYVTIPIVEGEVYTLGQIKLTGNFHLSGSQQTSILAPLQGSNVVVSRKTLQEVKTALEDALGHDGFSNADIDINTSIDEAKKTVSVAFVLEPKRRVYVRKISFVGNLSTQDEVLRRELPQMEGTWISTTLIKEGKERILRRGFGSNVEVETVAVPGSEDQVDIVYKIEEAKMGQIGGGVGYSQVDKLTFNFMIGQENFLGTGKAIDLLFEQSKSHVNYSLGLLDPYFTVDGVGLGANLYYSKSTLSKTSSLSDYVSDTAGIDSRLIFPISKYEAIRVGLGYDNTKIKAGNHGVLASEIRNFLNTNGNSFSEGILHAAWLYDSLDHRFMPTNGFAQTFNLRTVIPGAKLQYYKVTYEANYYRPLDSTSSWILNLTSNLGYGDGYGKTNKLPFYRHFVAGGSRSVRGFEENSLGPRDSLGRSFGGNALISGTVALIFPNPLMPESKSVRTALFLDAGQVYDTRYKERIVGNTRISRSPGDIRFAAGMSLTWNSPFGAPLVFSLAKPINAKRGDEKRAFNFFLGTQL